MRLLLAILFPAFAFGQSVEVVKIDSLYYAVTTTVEENDTGRPDVSVDTTQIGSAAQSLSFARKGRRRAQRRYDEIKKRLTEENYPAQDRAWVAVFEELGYDVDSITTRRQYRNVFTDTITIRFRADRIPSGEESKYSTDTLPTGVQSLDLFPIITQAGRLILRSAETQTNWLTIIDANGGFEIRNFLGGTAHFFLFREGARARAYLEDLVVTSRASAARAVIREDGNPIQF